MKRILLLCTVMALALVLFAACNRGGDGGGIDTPVGQGNWETDTSPITLSVYFNASWFTDEWLTEPYTRSTAYITEKTGVTVEFIAPTGNEAEALQIMLASRDFPDIMMLSPYDTGYSSFIEAEVFVNLLDLANDFDNSFFDNVSESQIGWHSVSPGVLYAYPNFSTAFEVAMALGGDALRNIAGATMVGVRHDIYNALGRPSMRTPEEFLDVLQRVHDEFPTVDGMPFHTMQMEFGDGGSSFIDGYLPALLGLPEVVPGGGAIYDRLSNELYLEWLRTFRLAFERGLISRDVFIHTRVQWSELYYAASYFLVTMGRSDAAGGNNRFWSEHDGQETGIWYEVARDIFRNPDGSEPRVGANILLDGWMNSHITISNNDPVRTFRFLNFMMGREGQYITWFGREGASYEYIDGVPTHKDYIWDIDHEDHMRRFFVGGNFWAWWNNDIMNSFPRGEEELTAMTGWVDFGVDYMHFAPEWAGTWFIDPTEHPEEALMETNLSLEWGQTLPRLLLAESDAEFDQILEAFLARREQLGHEQVQSLRYQKMLANRERLGIER